MNIPDDCINIIYSFLFDYDDVKSLRLVCKDFAYSTRPSLDQFIPNYITTRSFYEVGRKGQTHLVQYLVNKNLIDSYTRLQIVDGLCHCKSITNIKFILDLLNCELSSRHYYHFYRKNVIDIKQLPNIDKIFLECHRHNDAETYIRLIQHVSPPSNVRMFFVDEKIMLCTDDDLLFLIGTSTKNLQVVTHSVKYNEMSESDFVNRCVKKPIVTEQNLKVFAKWMGKKSYKNFCTALCNHIFSNNIKLCGHLVDYLIEKSYKKNIYETLYNSVFYTEERLPDVVIKKYRKQHEHLLIKANETANEVSRHNRYLNETIRKYLGIYKIEKTDFAVKELDKYIEMSSHFYGETIIKAINTSYFQTIFESGQINDQLLAKIFLSALEADAIDDVVYMYDSTNIKQIIKELPKEAFARFNVRIKLLENNMC